MKGKTIKPNQLIRSTFMLTCLAVLLAVTPVVTAQPAGTPAGIPETEITTLRQEVAGINTQTSAVKNAGPDARDR